MNTRTSMQRLPEKGSAARPVVLVHGIFDSAKIFNSMSLFLASQGFFPLALSLTPSGGEIGLDELALQLKTFVDQQLPSGEPFDLIGFSMGGLVSRYYVQRLGGVERVRRLITISSPHRGTYWAYVMRNAGCRQMRPRSAFLEELNRDMKMLEQVKFASLWTPLDLMILPSGSSRLGVGEEFMLAVAAHQRMVVSRISLELILKLLREAQDN